MDPPTRRHPFALHLRRYAPFYVFAALGLLAAVVAPTVQDDRAPATDLGSGGFSASGGSTVPPGSGTDAAGSSTTAAGQPGQSRGGPAPTQAGGDAAPAPAPGGSAGGTPGTGKTVGGFDCAPGVRQLPWSQYTAPCLAAFTGKNPGATARGVTADTIRVVVRAYATDGDASALDAVLAVAGVDREENRRRQAAFIEYFNKVFELYGRKVEAIDFTSNANPFDEANGRGREQACADATRIAEELDAFAVIPSDGIAFGPFTECAAARGLFQPVGAYGFPQAFYARLHPYVWGTQMNCDRINTLYAEYIVKRLAGGKAVYASDLLYKEQPRRFGIIQPDIEYYFPCIRLLAKELDRQGIDVVSTFDYVLDPATLPTQMNRAVVQFKADGVNSLLSVADFLTMINLTRAAASQSWGPEWILQGSGLQDAYSFARLYDQSVVDGHMFGMSQGGDAKAVLGPDGEVVRSYKEATGQALEPPETGNYFQVIHMFNQLQAAGPTLTAQTAADGTFSLPPSGPSLASGLWNFGVLANGQPGRQHTAITDAREVFWDRRAEAPDGSAGDFVGTMGGRRFGVGQWPKGQPKR